MVWFHHIKGSGDGVASILPRMVMAWFKAALSTTNINYCPLLFWHRCCYLDGLLPLVTSHIGRSTNKQ